MGTGEPVDDELGATLFAMYFMRRADNVWYALNATQPLINTFRKVANALPTTGNISSPSWIWHAVGFISVC